MTSSRVRLRVCEAKSKASSASRNTKERLHFHLERKGCSVCPEFLTARARESEMGWRGAQETGKVVPFGGLPLTSGEGRKDSVSSHCCCW